MAKDSRKMTILITGGSGFIAQHIANLLLEQTDIKIRELKTFDIRPFKWAKGLETITKHGVTFTHTEGDICKPEDVQRALVGVDAVFHVCSMVDFRPYPDVRKLNAINVKGTQNVLQACKDNNVEYLVYTSSIEIANSTKPVINADEDTVDKVPTAFVFPVYGSSKYAAERLVCDAHDSKLANGSKLFTCALRPPGVYGEGDTIYGDTLSFLVNSGTHFLIGEPTGKSQWAYGGNIAWAHICALKELMNPQSKDPLEGRALFLGDNTPLVSVGEFLVPYAKAFDVYVAPITPPFWMMLILGFFIDMIALIVSPFMRMKVTLHSATIRYLYSQVHFDWSKSRKILQYTPKFTPEEAFDRSVEYYKHYLKTGQVGKLEPAQEAIF